MPRRPNRPAANASFASKRRYLLKVCGHADMLFGRMSYAEHEDDLMAQYALAKVMQEIGERLVPGNGHVRPSCQISSPRCAMTSCIICITTTTPT